MINYSRVDTFKQCPYKYKLRYIDCLKTVEAPLPDDALVLGTVFHTGLEKGLEAAIEQYRDSFNVWTDKHENELIKLEILIPKAREVLEYKGAEFETPIKYGEFIGYADYLRAINNGIMQLLDFKYCSKSGLKRYPESGQLHVYAHYLRKLGVNVSEMAYLCVPKVQIRQKGSENLCQFRQRLKETCEAVEPVFLPVEFRAEKIHEFKRGVQHMKAATEFPKEPTRLCDWCEYKEYCQKGSKEMILPSTERRDIEQVTRRKIWIYGASFSGKTTMLDSAPNPLNLNTDGNIQFVTMPYISIRDEVKVEGRMTKRKFAWEIFKDTIAELEKKQNDFKSIIIDLVEDTREMCRLYKYDEMGIQHESDSGYGKGWDIIKTEYLSTMRRFFNLDYENLIIVSHEKISEVNKKNGQVITSISPNIQEAIANKLAGMVDIVARVVVEDDGTRTLNFKSNEYIFGGGRLKGIEQTSIPLDWGALCEVYETAAKSSNAKKPVRKTAKPVKVEEPETVEPEPEQETPKRRTRKTRKVEEPPFDEAEQVEETEEKPVKRTRKRRVNKE